MWDIINYSKKQREDMLSAVNQTHKQLIDYLWKQGTIKSKNVYETLLKIDRKYFVPSAPYYQDRPSYIGYGATISAPHMHAFALQYLEKQLISAQNVLDVGSGTGILTLAMSLMTQNKQAKVYGVQHIPELVDMSIKNITACMPEILKEKKIEIKVGDGRKGWENKNIKFDVIHVGAAPEKIPQMLIEQLKEGGVMVIPVGMEHGIQKFVKVTKKDGKISEHLINEVRYVPLTDADYQLKSA